MAKSQNDIDIYYAAGNANTKRQEIEIAAIMKIRNEAGWKLISTSTAVVDTKNQFSNLYLFWEKDIQLFYIQKMFQSKYLSANYLSESIFFIDTKKKINNPIIILGGFLITKEAYDEAKNIIENVFKRKVCLLYTSPSPRDNPASRMPSSA